MSLKPWGPGWGKGRRGDRGLLHSRLSRPAPSARGGGGGVLGEAQAPPNSRAWPWDTSLAGKLGPEPSAWSNSPRRLGHNEVPADGHGQRGSLRDAGGASCGLLIESSSAKCFRAGRARPRRVQSFINLKLFCSNRLCTESTTAALQKPGRRAPSGPVRRRAQRCGA